MIESVARPALAGFSEEGLARAYGLLAKAVADGALMGAVLQVSRAGKVLPVAHFGRRQVKADGAAVEPDTLFLVASITKPIVCAALMRLVEQGHLGLGDSVADLVPEFGNRGKEAVQVRHLLTHTSGLPDMVPENQALRKQHAPLSAFIERICTLDLLFEPGTRISYQSCGIAMIGEIIERIEGRPVREVMREAMFAPLGLGDMSLGRQDGLRDRISEVQMPAQSDAGGGGTDWDWNSDYWHHFGAPWGGLFTTAADLTRFCQALLFGGALEGTRILGRATVAAMVRDQTSSLPDLPASEKMRQRWGLGWRIGDGMYSDLTSPRTFGHSGATGTMVWMDPETEVTCVLLTNDPTGARKLRPLVSNAIAGAVV